MRKMNIFIMTLAGLLLIAASVLKFHELLSLCIPSWETRAAIWLQDAQKAGEAMPVWKANLLGFWESYEFFLIQIPLEFALGVWMVSGLFRKAAWLAGTFAFLGFIFVTLFKWLTGAESCGCFGQIHVDPKITLFAMDIPIFLLLAMFWPPRCKILPPPWPNVFYLLTVAIPVLGVLALAAPALVTFRPDCVRVEPFIPGEKEQEKFREFMRQHLEQKQQQEQPSQQGAENQQPQTEQPPPQPPVAPVEPSLPPAEPVEPVPAVESQADPQTEQPAPQVEQWDWLQYVVEEDVREQLTTGLVVILMYHHDCPDCAVMVPQYSDYYKDMQAQGNEAFKVAFLAVPPYGDEGPVPDDTPCIHGKLTDQRLWELTSPYVVVLLDGERMKTWPQGTAPEPDKILDEIFAP